MMDFSLWGLLGNTSSVITIVSEMRAFLNSASEKCAVQELERLNPSVDFSALPDDLAYCADKIEIYIAKHKQEVLKDNLFPEGDKNDFVRSFFEEYPDLLPYKKYAEDWLRAYLNYAETLILQNADITQKLLYYENSVALLDIQRHLPYPRGLGIYHLAAFRIVFSDVPT